MKSKKCRYPFVGYRFYVSPDIDGRVRYYLYNSSTNHRMWLTRARYRMSVKLGRLLKKSEHVDHKDEDFTNDSINNLQLLTQKENNKKHVLLSGKTQKVRRLKCPACKKIFVRLAHRVDWKIRNGKKPACSRSCGNIGS